MCLLYAQEKTKLLQTRGNKRVTNLLLGFVTFSKVDFIDQRYSNKYKHIVVLFLPYLLDIKKVLCISSQILFYVFIASFHRHELKINQDSLV